MGIIYLDSLFLINFIADYILLLTAARVSALSYKRGRYMLSAVFGAALSVLAVLPDWYFLNSLLFRLASAAVMGIIAYGGEQEPIRCTAVFLAVSASFGGACAALGTESLSLPILCAAFAVSYLLLSLISICRAKLSTRKTCTVRLSFLGRSVCFSALIDSGNCLTDPISGADVLIVRAAELRKLFCGSESLLDVTDPVEFITLAEAFPELCGKFRLLPYSVLGGGGMLPVFRPDSVTVDGEERRSILCAVAHTLNGSSLGAII